MKKFFIALMVMATTLTFAISDAEARRMGGGGSFGKQSQSFSRPAPTQSSQATSATRPTNAATPPKAVSPWRGMLGGALLGLGLGALLSHLGIGGALASMISTILMVALFGLAAMFIYRMIMRKKHGNDRAQPAFAGYSARTSNTPEIGSHLGALGGTSAQPSALQLDNAVSDANQQAGQAPFGVPADFDVPGFLRNAKTYFIRLQAAWDRAAVNDIAEFTTPEMFAELKMQLQERGASANHTDVVSIDAELMGIETAGTEYLASVKFSGMIRESENASAEPFSEAWNLSKPVSGQGGWLLAGIQQLS